MGTPNAGAVGRPQGQGAVGPAANTQYNRGHLPRVLSKSGSTPELEFVSQTTLDVKASYAALKDGEITPARFAKRFVNTLKKDSEMKKAFDDTIKEMNGGKMPREQDVEQVVANMAADWKDSHRWFVGTLLSKTEVETGTERYKSSGTWMEKALKENSRFRKVMMYLFNNPSQIGRVDTVPEKPEAVDVKPVTPKSDFEILGEALRGENILGGALVLMKWAAIHQTPVMDVSGRMNDMDALRAGASSGSGVLSVEGAPQNTHIISNFVSNFVPNLFGSGSDGAAESSTDLPTAGSVRARRQTVPTPTCTDSQDQLAATRIESSNTYTNLPTLIQNGQGARGALIDPKLTALRSGSISAAQYNSDIHSALSTSGLNAQQLAELLVQDSDCVVTTTSSPTSTPTSSPTSSPSSTPTSSPTNTPTSSPTTTPTGITITTTSPTTGVSTSTTSVLTESPTGQATVATTSTTNAPTTAQPSTQSPSGTAETSTPPTSTPTRVTTVSSAPVTAAPSTSRAPSTLPPTGPPTRVTTVSSAPVTAAPSTSRAPSTLPPTGPPTVLATVTTSTPTTTPTQTPSDTTAQPSTTTIVIVDPSNGNKTESTSSAGDDGTLSGIIVTIILMTLGSAGLVALRRHLQAKKERRAAQVVDGQGVIVEMQPGPAAERRSSVVYNQAYPHGGPPSAPRAGRAPAPPPQAAVVRRGASPDAKGVQHGYLRIEGADAALPPLPQKRSTAESRRTLFSKMSSASASGEVENIYIQTVTFRSTDSVELKLDGEGRLCIKSIGKKPQYNGYTIISLAGKVGTEYSLEEAEALLKTGDFRALIMPPEMVEEAEYDHDDAEAPVVPMPDPIYVPTKTKQTALEKMSLDELRQMVSRAQVVHGRADYDTNKAALNELADRVVEDFLTKIGVDPSEALTRQQREENRGLREAGKPIRHVCFAVALDLDGTQLRHLWGLWANAAWKSQIPCDVHQSTSYADLSEDNPRIKQDLAILRQDPGFMAAIKTAFDIPMQIAFRNAVRRFHGEFATVSRSGQRMVDATQVLLHEMYGLPLPAMTIGREQVTASGTERTKADLLSRQIGGISADQVVVVEDHRSDNAFRAGGTLARKECRDGDVTVIGLEKVDHTTDPRDVRYYQRDPHTQHGMTRESLGSVPELAGGTGV